MRARPDWGERPVASAAATRSRANSLWPNCCSGASIRRPRVSALREWLELIALIEEATVVGAFSAISVSRRRYRLRGFGVGNRMGLCKQLLGSLRRTQNNATTVQMEVRIEQNQSIVAGESQYDSNSNVPTTLSAALAEARTLVHSVGEGAPVTPPVEMIPAHLDPFDDGQIATTSTKSDKPAKSSGFRV